MSTKQSSSSKKRRFINFVEQTNLEHETKKPMRKVELTDTTTKKAKQQICEFFVTDDGDIHRPEQVTTRSSHKQWLDFLAQQRIFFLQHPEFLEQLKKWQTERIEPKEDSIKKVVCHSFYLLFFWFCILLISIHEVDR